ncbi:MAG: nucleoside triphosphate pyrophosphohydrolase [Acidobacteriaceae bacterium]|nr:nucleoside triphosphate pyrophosphohydrolase [Acidobacteriaceae bacterium]
MGGPNTGFRYARSVTDRFEEAGSKFAELVRIMARLRAPGGCPWDRKQTFESIKPYTLEETYEVLDAIDRRDWAELAEELGDLLLQPVFFAEMATEENLFTITDSLDAINTKLIRRHPHVFGDAKAQTAEDVKERWDQIKKQEKSDKRRDAMASILDGVPRSLPALVEAEKVSNKAAAAGFEWPDVAGVLDKLQEEARELAAARDSGSQEHIEHEIGDLFFTVVNFARFLKIDPEQALRKTTARFRRRFSHIERELVKSGGELSTTPLKRMEELWQEAKRFDRDE